MASFIWGVGVAGVNAYKIYEVIYAKVAMETPKLPGHMLDLGTSWFMILFLPAAHIGSQWIALPQQGH